MASVAEVFGGVGGAKLDVVDQLELGPNNTHLAPFQALVLGFSDSV